MVNSRNIPHTIGKNTHLNKSPSTFLQPRVIAEEKSDTISPESVGSNDSKQLPLIINPYFHHQFKSFDMLKRKHSRKGGFISIGTLKYFLEENNDGILPDFDLFSSMENDSELVVLSSDEKDQIFKDYGVKIDNVKLMDKSHLTDKLVTYIREHVRLDKSWNDTIGKHLWIVISAMYTNNATKTTTKWKLFKKETLISSLSTTHETSWVTFAFTCLKIKFNRDGRVGKIEVVKK